MINLPCLGVRINNPTIVLRKRNVITSSFFFNTHKKSVISSLSYYSASTKTAHINLNTNINSNININSNSNSNINNNGNGNVNSSNNKNGDKIGRLILVRHGQSRWNVTCPKMGTTARFTGWADVDLTKRGVEQAIASGRAIRSFLLDTTQSTSNATHHNNTNINTKINTNTNTNIIADTHNATGRITIDAIYCSLLSRAKDTMNLALNELDLLVDCNNIKIKNNSNNNNNNNIVNGNNRASYSYKVPVITSWRLNERHYGSLVGLSKDGAEQLYGKEKLSIWRNSWDVPPPPMDIHQLRKWVDLEHTRPATVVTDRYHSNSSHNDDDDIESNNFNISSHSSNDTQRSTRNTNNTSNNSRQFTILEKGPFFNESIDDGDNNTSRITINDFKTSSTSGTTMTNGTASPPPSSSSPALNQHNDNDNNDKTINNNMPASESLSDTCRRVLPILEEGIVPRLRNGQTVVIFAHANTIRSILYHIDQEAVTKDTMKKVKVPSARPLLYSFCNDNSDASANITTISAEDKIPILGGLHLIRYNGYKNGNTLDDGIIQLNGQWLNNVDVDNLSFCSDEGQQNLEHEIA